MVAYDSATSYVESCTTLQARIAAIDAIIDGLFTSALKAAEKGDVKEYWLNDGQVLIKTTYRNAEEVSKSILHFQKIRVMYENRLTGRAFRLVDGKNMIGCG